jgi:hypothetical protein
MGKIKEAAIEALNQEPEAPVNIHLNPAITDRFKVVGTHCPRVLNTTIGDIDFATLTAEQAEQLVTDGFIFLERIV